MIYDVIIIGAGPAGLTCAGALASKGLSTLVLERADKPNKNKLCGGMLQAYIFEKFGLDRSMCDDEITSVKINFHDKSFLFKYEEPVAYNVDRNRLAESLASKAIKNGAEVLLNNEASGISYDGELAVVEASEKFKCKVLVGADGIYSKVAREVFGKKNPHEGAGFCLQKEINASKPVISAEIPGTNEFYFGSEITPFGYGWLFPYSRSGHIVCGLGNLHSCRDNTLSQYMESFIKKSRVEERFEDCTISETRGAFVPLGGVQEPLATRNALLIGDALGAVSPITGEGIHYAMESGLIASGVIERFLSEGSPLYRHYKKDIHRRFGNDFKWALFARKHYKAGSNRKVLSSEKFAKATADLFSGKINHKGYVKKALVCALKSKIFPH